ncbi:uncharacterized protein LOC124111656 [Haliotis rufescens]|uniref:uncharacterized protein LOC124111656 n=1 Tax=Haliotis rufescens TaxID=6454 RepID=UPI00201F7A6D|nr:uncharacterized protein LOC124111656 [Haliotis rufescens]
MYLALLLVLFVIVAFAKDSFYIYQFARQVALDGYKVEELVASVATCARVDDCVRICARDEVCVAVTYRQNKCSIYRSSVSSSGILLSEATTYVKQGALPSPDPCPVSGGYTSVLSPRLCYRLHKGGKKWPQTQSLCAAEGGRLIILNEDEKYDYLAAYTKRIDFRPWIGLLVENKTYHAWTDGSTHIRDGAKSPNKFFIGYSACGFLYRGEIRSRFCRNPYGYLCEIVIT